ncbi:MAG: hypothetical protein EOP53_15240 [Sphingobacteriales bacterium]|nr:MAG: hypothetical protein EOP53_15240 [Sphingobacteriales bacterium]
MEIQFLENNKISIGGKAAKQLTKYSTITSNRTVVGFQITIRYNDDDFDILTYKKSELKTYTETLTALRNKIIAIS